MRRINRDSFPHLVDVVCRRANEHFFTFWARVAARWWRVHLGTDCSFFGRARFFRHPHSRISIGAGCIFRSSPASNPSGINRPCIISTLHEGAEIEIGSNCGFSGTAIACAVKIVLGEQVRCSPNTWIIDTEGHWDDPRTGPNIPIIIQSGVWLGANVSVLSGVTIGENTLVAAGSIVTKSLPPNVIAAGIPAKVIRPI